MAPERGLSVSEVFGIPAGDASWRELAWPALVGLIALAFAAGAVFVEASSPDKGFLTFVRQRVVTVDPGSEVDRAGVRPGYRVVALDGREVGSTLDYARDILARPIGETIDVTFERVDGTRQTVPVTLRRTPTPWAGIVAVLLAALMVALGLIALRGRPGLASKRFFRTTVVFTLIYAGSLYWNHLIPYPWLAVGPLVALFCGPPVVLDFLLGFPATKDPLGRRARLAAWGLSLAFGVGAGWSLIEAMRLEAAGRPAEVMLARAVGFVGAQLVLVLGCFFVGVFVQARRVRRSRGAARAQRKWLLFGFALCLAPLLASVPAAVRDFDAFLLGGARPYLTALMFVWFGATALGVLRVRLADVDRVIHRSATYGIALGVAALLYFAIALSLGLALERLLPAAPWVSHLSGAGLAALLFGPIHRRVGGWIERRFFRDRLHYVRALRELSATLLEVRETSALAEEVVERSVRAVRARGGALYVADPTGRSEVLDLAHAVGETPAKLHRELALDPPEDGVAIEVHDGERLEGVLRLGARRGGDLYSSEDRDLLETLAGQLAIALGSSRAFTKITELGRTLESQNEQIRELRDKLEDENRYLKGRLDAEEAERRIVGSSRAVKELRKNVERLARSNATVLVRGESGTGKSLVARALHDASERADGPFVQVDCGALAKGVFESELFGHERGAFTGAVRMRRGCFELADGGTLFLDEVGELPLELQPKLLRVLQERTFTRLGGNEEVKVDVRIIAATHRDLDAMVARGELRRDLYYRLSVVTFEVPPLRARRKDVPALVESTLPKLCRRNHRPPRELSDAAMAHLATYEWPGNVRELENLLERAVVLADRDTIEPEDLPLPARLVRSEPPPSSEPPPPTLKEEIELVERERLAHALALAHGNKSQAARALGMPRTTLISKLRKHGLE